MDTATRKRLEASSWFAVVRAYNECNRRYSRLLHSFDLTIPQFDVLEAIRSLGPRAMPRLIADALVVTRGNVSGVLQRLKERGLITTRQHAQDGRSFVCELTEAGRALHGRARRAAGRFIGAQLEPFDTDTLRETERTMTRMHAHLQTIDPDAIVAALNARGGDA